MELIYVYVTVPASSIAEIISIGLVKERIAACVNIIPNMKTIYRWQGEIEDGEEAIMIIKTGASRQQDVIDYVRQHHPYHSPCITVHPVTGGDPAYLKWIEVCSTPTKLA